MTQRLGTITHAIWQCVHSHKIVLQFTYTHFILLRNWHER